MLNYAPANDDIATVYELGCIMLWDVFYFNHADMAMLFYIIQRQRIPLDKVEVEPTRSHGADMVSGHDTFNWRILWKLQISLQKT